MREKQLFEYAVIRVVPHVEREEFLNVGAIVYCPSQQFLQTAFEINEERLRAFVPQLERAEVEKHIRAFQLICAGGSDAGVIGEMPARARFSWLTAPRSTIVQTSPVHTGLCSDPEDALRRLLETMVR